MCFHEASFCEVKMQALRNRVESLRSDVPIPLLGWNERAGRLGQPQALTASKFFALKSDGSHFSFTEKCWRSRAE
ncbi:MAG: hypothetical protein ABL925_05840 [Methylococcales bacterium]